MTFGLAVETVLTFTIGLVGTYEGYRLAQEPLLWKDPVGPGWFLFWVSALIVVLGLVRIFRPGSAVAGVSESDAGSVKITSPAFKLLGVLAVYVAVVPLLGYEIASFFFFAAALKIAGVATWRNSLLIAVVVTVAFYFFAREMNIYLP
jgi:hypothetical protein